jgi:hypothetical protein
MKKLKAGLLVLPILSLLLVTGCVDKEVKTGGQDGVMGEEAVRVTPEVPIPEEAIIKLDPVVEEFNKHSVLFNKENAEIGVLLALLDRGEVDSEKNYLDFADTQINHLNEFYTFFMENKEELKKNDIDTFKWNNNIVDTSEKLKNKTKELGHPID